MLLADGERPRKFAHRQLNHFGINGTKLYSTFIDNETDEAKKDLLIDTLEWFYDQRIAHFGNEGYVRGRKRF